MPTRHYILDTNVIERDKFRFNYGVLKKTKYLTDNGFLVQLSNKIIIDEVKRHIADHSERIASKFNGFYKDSLMIRHSGIEKYDPYNSQITASEIEKDILELADKFYGGATLVPLELADNDEVFELYNEKLPPFGKGDKEKEFPDAFFLSAVHNWAQSKKTKVRVISRDNGVIEYCNETEHLVSSTDLREAIQDTFDEFVVYQSHEIFDALIPDIEVALKEQILDSTMYSSVDIDSDVYDVELTDIDQIDRYTFDRTDDVITFNCFADITLTATIDIPDPAMSYFDKEDGERHVFEFISVKHTQKFRLIYTTKFRFDPENLDDYELVEVKIDEPGVIDFDEVDINEL